MAGPAEPRKFETRSRRPDSSCFFGSLGSSVSLRSLRCHCVSRSRAAADLPAAGCYRRACARSQRLWWAVPHARLRRELAERRRRLVSGRRSVARHRSGRLQPSADGHRHRAPPGPATAAVPGQAEEPGRACSEPRSPWRSCRWEGCAVCHSRRDIPLRRQSVAASRGAERGCACSRALLGARRPSAPT